MIKDITSAEIKNVTGGGGKKVTGGDEREQRRIAVYQLAVCAGLAFSYMCMPSAIIINSTTFDANYHLMSYLFRHPENTRATNGSANANNSRLG